MDHTAFPKTHVIDNTEMDFDKDQSSSSSPTLLEPFDEPKIRPKSTSPARCVTNLTNLQKSKTFNHTSRDDGLIYNGVDVIDSSDTTALIS